MAFWNRRSDPVLVPAAPSVAADLRANEQQMRDAYKRGRQDERARRKRHPVAMSVGFALAAVGAVVLAVAAYNGSFSRGGETLDRNLAVAADQAEPVVRDAADDAARAVSTAGTDLRDRVTGDEAGDSGVAPAATPPAQR